MNARSFPTWRRIETILIELLREEGFEIEQESGETFTSLIADGDTMEVIEINLGDFARQLEERL